MKKMILAMTLLAACLMNKTHAVVMPTDPEAAKALSEAMKLNPGVWGSVNTGIMPSGVGFGALK